MMTNTPLLVNAFLMPTNAGAELVTWLEAQGFEPPAMPAPPNSLIKPIMRWLVSLSEQDRAGLWAEYQASLGIVRLVEGERRPPFGGEG